MPKPQSDFDDAKLHDVLTKESSARIERYTQALDGLIEGRRRLADQLTNDPSLKEHIANAARLADARGKGMQEASAGKTSRAKVLGKLGRDWSKVFSDPARDTLAKAYDQAGATHGGERAWLERAFDVADRPVKHWDGRYGDLGWEHLTPFFPPTNDDDTGTVQQGLMDPITLCVGPPYAFPDTASTTSGIAFVSASPAATPSSGRIFLLSQTFAPVFAGGGTDSMALVGSDISWPAGFDTMAVTADINLTFSSLFAVAIFGGATASAELVLRIAMSDGRNFRTGVPIGSAVAPLLWHTSISQSGQRTVMQGGIPLNGKAGTARLMAGLHDNTAAVGIVGSSGANSFLGANITKICAAIS